MILAGDVGGTKVHLAIYNFVGGRLDLVRREEVSIERVWFAG
jgi:glucokinase